MKKLETLLFPTEFRVKIDRVGVEAVAHLREIHFKGLCIVAGPENKYTSLS